ncbi:MAG: tRNA pseudouridine(38-40) synthase TruA [Acidimicrobiales bacterium]
MSAAVRRWRLDLAYDGSGFRGFAAQAQPGLPTVAGALAGAIARAARTGEPPAIVCAGRTDAGVHATGQVVHVDLPEDYDADLKHALNRQLAPSIVVHVASPAAEGFDARRAATSRHYRYLVLAAPDPDPLLSGLAWHVPEPLDVRAMASATDPLLGEHDFRAFCRRAPGRAREEPIVRQVISATWRQVAGPFGDAASDAPCPAGPLGLLRFDIAAGSFCHQMVRSIVAVLVDAGRGRATAASVMELLASGSRAGAPRPAPAHGLCLTSVDYESVESTGRAAEGRAGTGGGLP